MKVTSRVRPHLFSPFTYQHLQVHFYGIEVGCLFATGISQAFMHLPKLPEYAPNPRISKEMPQEHTQDVLQEIPKA